MEFTCYEAAYAAVVKDNDGVLPDLYETTDITILNQPYNSAKKLTVADIVANALVEVSMLKATTPSKQPITSEPLYVEASTGELLHIDKLLDQAVTSVN
ncbi:MAG: hypothetical protein EOO61_18535 [Hymenobacter sp.]|nr:MAG: hypothetical protein EOO61_18535 [Hymenobacter sp.]